MVCSVWSISRTDLFQSPSEEDELDPGSDESVEVKLDSGLHFMGETLKTVYVSAPRRYCYVAISSALIKFMT